jgi:hypothetical protein
MATARQKNRKSKLFRNLKRVTVAASVLAVALLGLWIGKDGFRTSAKHLDEREIRFHFIDVG